MKIALALVKRFGGDIKGNLQKLLSFSSIAKEKGCSMILFGESYLQGETGSSPVSSDCPELSFVSRLAKQKGLAIGLGFNRLEKGKAFSSYVVFSSNGEEIASLDKGKGPLAFSLLDHHFLLCLGGDLPKEETKGKTAILVGDDESVTPMDGDYPELLLLKNPTKGKDGLAASYQNGKKLAEIANQNENIFIKSLIE